MGGGASGASEASGMSGMRAVRQLAVSGAFRFSSLEGRSSGRAREFRTVAGVSQLEEGSMETSEYVGGVVPFADKRVAVTILTGFLGSGKV